MSTREEKIAARVERNNNLIDQRFERKQQRGPHSPVIRRNKMETIRALHNGNVSVLRYIFDAFATSTPTTIEPPQDESYLHPVDLLNMSIAFHLQIDGVDPMSSNSSSSTSSLHNIEIAQRSIQVMNAFWTTKTETVDNPSTTLQPAQQPKPSSIGLHWHAFQHWCRTNHATLQQQVPEVEVVAFLNQLVARIVPLNGKLVTQSLLFEYKQYDSDQSLTMDQEELLAWMNAVHRESGSAAMLPTVQMSTQIINTLDKDQNGSVDPQEWMEWMRSGQEVLLTDAKKKEEFMNQGPENRCILDFLDMVVLRSVHRCESKINAIKMKWAQHYVNADGSKCEEIEQERKKEQKDQKDQKDQEEKVPPKSPSVSTAPLLPASDASSRKAWRKNVNTPELPLPPLNTNQLKALFRQYDNDLSDGKLKFKLTFQF